MIRLFASVLLLGAIAACGGTDSACTDGNLRCVAGAGTQDVEKCFAAKPGDAVAWHSWTTCAGVMQGGASCVQCSSRSAECSANGRCL